MINKNIQDYSKLRKELMSSEQVKKDFLKRCQELNKEIDQDYKKISKLSSEKEVLKEIKELLLNYKAR